MDCAAIIQDTIADKQQSFAQNNSNTSLSRSGKKRARQQRALTTLRNQNFDLLDQVDNWRVAREQDLHDTAQSIAKLSKEAKSANSQIQLLKAAKAELAAQVFAQSESLAIHNKQLGDSKKARIRSFLAASP